jgi:ribosomal protein S18 acetylase RimI-like enzyme
MTDLDVRPFEEADQPAVTALWSASFEDNSGRNAPDRIIQKKLSTQRELFLVGCIGERLVATVLGGYDGHRGWIYHLAVDPEERRKGVGRQLVEAAEAELCARGCPKINLQVRAENAGVVAFYERLGYAIEERLSLGKVIE